MAKSEKVGEVDSRGKFFCDNRIEGCPRIKNKKDFSNNVSHGKIHLKFLKLRI